MALGANQMTVTTEAVFIPEVWSREILRAREDALVMAKAVKRYDSEVKKGDTLHIPNLSNLSVYTKAANTQVVLQAPTESENTISINQHDYVSFLIEDIAAVQADYALQAEYTKKAGFALAENLDTNLLGLYTQFSNADVGVYGTDITDAVIIAAIQALDEANAPLEGRKFVVAPSQKAAIMALARFTEAAYIGTSQQPSRVVKGPDNRYLWGDVYGTPVYYTNQVPTTAATPTQTHNILFQTEAIALGMQKSPRTQAQNRIDYLGTIVVVDQIYGYNILRADHGVEVRS